MKYFNLLNWTIQPDFSIKTFLVSAVKTPQRNVYLLIFGLCLSVGLMAGILIGNSIHLTNRMISEDNDSLQINPTISQENILFIGFDHFKSQSPVLESVWLMIYLPSKYHLNLLPIYPTPFDQSLFESNSITSIIKIDQQGHPTEEFFERLHSRDIRWNHYVLVDEAGMIETVNFFGGLQKESNVLNGANVINSLHLPWVNPSLSLQDQTSLLQGLCNEISQPSSNILDINKILKLIPDHIRTDMDVSEAIQYWLQLLSKENQLDCEFPLNGVLYP